MKKKLLLTSLLVLPLLAACDVTVITPKHTYPGDPIKENQGVTPDGDVDETEENMTVNFYLDYSHSDEPIFSMRWYMLKPLGECPKEAVLTDADAADPLYGKFLGYSEFSSSLDESKIWNFETDYKQSNFLNLYGIWVSE